MCPQGIDYRCFCISCSISAHTANVSQVHARICRVIFTPAVHLEIKHHHRYESFINGLVLCFTGVQLIVIPSALC